MREMLSLLANVLLYATSADAELEERPPAARLARGAVDPSALTSETVFYLPGKIEIGTLDQLKKARRGGGERAIARRCMVRGHWRRAPERWAEQRPRWIKPHWRGPSAVAIVERQYRLCS